TELTFWDAPDAGPYVTKDFQKVVHSFTAYLVISGEVVYQVNWGMESVYNPGGKPKKTFLGAEGNIPQRLSPFLSNPKSTLYRWDGVKAIANPVTKIGGALWVPAPGQ